MMKRTMAALLSLLLFAAMLTGCTQDGKEDSSSDGDASTASEKMVSAETVESENPEMDGESSVPDVPPEAEGEGAEANRLVPQLDKDVEIPTPDFLTEDQQLLYKAAYRMYYHYSMSVGFDPDPDQTLVGENGWTYHLNRAFSSYSEYRAVLNKVFTEDYAAFLNENELYIADENGRLYSSLGEREGRETYVGSTFELVSQSEDEITFHLIGHYNEGEANGEGGETAYSYPIHMVRTEDGWRFANFIFAN